MTLKTELQPAFKIHLDHKQTAVFDEVFLEATDSVFSLLGNPCKQAIYYHLENSYALNRAAIPHKIAEFAAALEALFGKAALLLEVQIMRSLHVRLQGFKHYPGTGGLLFVAYVEGLRRFMCA